MELWDRFSDDAKQAILRAHEVAREMQAPEVSPEHLALGIIAVERGSGCRMMRSMGVNLERLRDALLDAAPMGGTPSPEEMTLTSQAQRCLQAAYLEWRKHAAVVTGQGGDDIPDDFPFESVHLLLGLLAPSSRSECRTLISHGVFYGEVSELLRRGRRDTSG